MALGNGRSCRYDRGNKASPKAQASPKKGGMEMSVRITPMRETQIDRRIDFLIREANSEDPIRDQAITYSFRVITNYLSVACDARSRKLSRECPYRSKKAHDLSLLDREGWLDKVTNEHQYPIKRAWEWMIKERDKLTVGRVKNHLKKWPVVVVTKDENKLLRDDPDKEPDQRYEDAGIEVLEKTESGGWQPRGLPNQISD